MYRFKLQNLLIFFLFFSLLCSNSRIGYSRPSSFIRTPSAIAGNDYNNFFVGVGTEIINTTTLNYSRTIFLKAQTTSGFDYGVNYLTHADINSTDFDPPSEFLFHFTKEIYRYNNLIINLGLHDIPISTDIEDPAPSLFLTFINHNIQLRQKYFLQTAVGIGSGYINEDQHDHPEHQHHANIFFGLKLQTPWVIKNNKGADLFIEYTDGGLNLGIDLPVHANINFQCAFTHMENFYKYNDYHTSDTEAIYGDDAGIALSLQYRIPTKNNEIYLQEINLENVSIAEPEDNCYIGLIEHESTEPLRINDECTVGAIKQIVSDVNTSFKALHDSLLMINQNLESHELTNYALEFKVATLQDSIQQSLMNKQISKTELNIAIKSFTNSLKYYYTNEHHLALKELDKTIKYLPNLAAAYARRGSVYYKLGDIDRATVNWNYALQLDPEYNEVKEFLINVKNKRSDDADIHE